MAFNSYEFTFAGESSVMHNLMIYDIGGKSQGDTPFGSNASIVETRTNLRVQPLHFGVNYNKTPLQFKLVFGSHQALDRYEMEDIAYWLTGYQSYQWLSIDQPDLENVQFRCLITQLTPLSFGWLPYAFEATVVCDCPYAYSFPFERTYSINGETKILFRNDSLVREFVKPTLTFVPSSGTDKLSIVNSSDNGREFLIENLPSSSIIVSVDNTNGIIQETRYGFNLYDGFNLKFFRLVSGDNNLVVNGNGTLTISGRFYHNVAG